MNTKDLMKIAKAVYPDEIAEIEGEEVWFMNPYFYDYCKRKILITQFNPEKNMSQLYDCGEWLLNQWFTIETDKKELKYIVKLSGIGKFVMGKGNTYAEAILNALLEVLENDK